MNSIYNCDKRSIFILSLVCLREQKRLMCLRPGVIAGSADGINTELGPLAFGNKTELDALGFAPKSFRVVGLVIVGSKNAMMTESKET